VSGSITSTLEGNGVYKRDLQHVTTLIIDWRSGEQKARDELFALVYEV